MEETPLTTIYWVPVKHTAEDGYDTHPEAIIEVEAEDAHGAYMQIEGLILAGGDAADWQIGVATRATTPPGALALLRSIQRSIGRLDAECARTQYTDTAHLWLLLNRWNARIAELLESDASTPAERVRAAIHHLSAARDLLRTVGASRTLKRVRLAITSARGAERHALNAQHRSDRKLPTGGGRQPVTTLDPAPIPDPIH